MSSWPGVPVTIVSGSVGTISNGGGSVTPNADGSITITGLASGTTLTGGLTIDSLTMTVAASRIIPGATSFSIRDNANANDNLIVTNAGAVTTRAGLTVSSGGITVVGASVITNTGAGTVSIAGASNSGTITIGNAASGIFKLTSGAQIILSAVAGVLMAHTPVAVNATAVLTAAQVASGYITSTSALATTMTLPTATALATALGAVQGTIHDLYIDNTAGASTVTLALGAGFTASALDGSLTIVSGATGQAGWRIMFSSATAATITRIA